MENKNTISLAEAKKRVANWLKAAVSIFNNKIDKVPRGFFIPMADIQDLATKYPNAVGVQVYFTLDHPDFTPGDGINGILVPVELTADGVQRDMIDPEIEEDDADSSIYDFTKPCPPTCSTGNELYLTI
jgi:hypothetical protein